MPTLLVALLLLLCQQNFAQSASDAYQKLRKLNPQSQLDELEKQAGLLLNLADLSTEERANTLALIIPLLKNPKKEELRQNYRRSFQNLAKQEPQLAHLYHWTEAKLAEEQNKFEDMAEHKAKAIQSLEQNAEPKPELLYQYYTSLAHDFSINRLNRPKQKLNYSKKSLYLAKEHFGEGAEQYRNSLNLLASASLMNNAFADAETYNEDYGKALRQANELHNLHGYYMSKGNIYHRKGKHKEALAAFEQSLKLHKEHNIPNLFGRSMILGNIAIEHAMLGQVEQAYKIMSEKLELNRKQFGLHHVSIVRTSANLIDYALKLKKQDLALEHAKEAFLAATLNLESWPKDFQLDAFLKEQRFSSDMLKYIALRHYCKVLAANAKKEQSQLKEALASHKILLLETEQLLLSLSQDEDKTASFSRLGFAQSLEQTIELAKLLGNNEEALALAFYAAELNKSTLLRLALKSNIKQKPSFEQLAQEEGELRQKQNRLELELKAASRKKQELQMSQLQSQLIALDAEKQAFLKKLQTKYPDYYKENYTLPVISLKDFQALLPENTLVLLYALANEEGKSSVFCIDKKSCKIENLTLASGDSLNRSINSLHKTLSDYVFIQDNPEKAKTQFYNASRTAYDAVIPKTLSQYQGIEHLVIIPDNILAYTPFEVFLSPEATVEQGYSEWPYLIRDYAISYSYSATLLQENMKAQKQRGSGSLSMLGIAANYDKEGIEAAASRSPYAKQLRNILAPLPQAEREVEELEKRFQGRFLYGMEASEQNFKQLAPSYGVLHLAMHGLLDSNEPLLSSLAFSETGEGEEDNFLQAFEIAELPLNAALVVLSACETGFGKFQSGEGVLSLARYFMYAGVPAINMSLWEVNDQSTARIMQLFYGELARGQNKAQALQSAKLKFLENQEGSLAAHPAYWAPYIQLGDWQALELKSKGPRWNLLFAALAGAIALAFFTLFVRHRLKSKVSSLP